MPFHKESQRTYEEATFVSKTFTASKSLLEKYFSGCAHRAYLYRRWNLKEKYMPKPLKFGIEVHDAIEKAIDGKDLYDKGTLKSEYSGTAIARAERAINWLDKKGWTVLATEVDHFAPLSETINVFGVIDAIAENDKGETILIDWKTAKSLWTPTVLADGSTVYIGAQGWQGAVYLTVPFKSDIVEPSEWPTKMLYVVIPEFETVGAYEYEKNDADDQALIRACEVVKDAKEDDNYPKNKGYQCDAGFGCDFKKVCWEQKGWTKYYDPRNAAAEKQYKKANFKHSSPLL